MLPGPAYFGEVVEFTFRAVGVIHSCFKEKFGIPRQPGLVPAARAVLELFPRITSYNVCYTKLLRDKRGFKTNYNNLCLGLVFA